MQFRPSDRSFPVIGNSDNSGAAVSSEKSAGICRRKFLAGLGMTAAALAGSWGAPAALAQSGRSRMPNENELNRLGLTLSWWGQASVKSSQERVSFFTADEQNVYVQSKAGIITTFQGESGRRLWSQLVGAPNQYAYAATSGETDVLVGLGLKVYAFNKVTGVPHWELNLPSPPSASPKEEGRFLYVPTVDGMLRAYDVEKLGALAKRALLPQWTNRAELWTYQMPAPSISTPIPVNDQVIFASSRGNIYRMLGAENKLEFIMEGNAPLSAPITYSRDYVFAADVRSRLLCVNINSGGVLWSFSSGAPIRKKPSVVGKQLFVVAEREGMSALDIHTGLRRWEQPIATDLVAVTDSRVYASDSGNNLLILDRGTGRVQGQVRLGEFNLRVQNDRTDRIYAASAGGTVIALRELASEYPLYHLYPERRPILPDVAPEGDAEAIPADNNAESNADAAQ